MSADYLPTEIISHIMRFLSVSDRKDASLVCKKWYSASLEPYLQKDIIVKCQPPRAGSLPPSALVQRKLTHLILGDWDSMAISEEGLITLLGKCPSLQVLDLSSCNSLFLSGKLLHQESDRQMLKDTLSNVKELRLACLRHMSDVTFTRLTSIMHNLETLSVASVNMIFGSHCDVNNASPAVLNFSTLIRYVRDHANSLKNIDLSFTTVNDKALGNLVRIEGLALDMIQLKGCSELSDKGIRELVANQKSLQVIDLAGSRELGTSKAFFSMFSSLPKLHTLNLRKCAQVGQCDVYNLSQMNSLKVLDMGEVLNLHDDDVIRGLCEKKSNLVSVSLPYCPDLKDGVVVHLTESNSMLTYLDLTSCTKLTDISLHAITRHLSCLRTLRIAYCRDISDIGILGYVPENGVVMPHHVFDFDHVGCCCTREKESKIFRKPSGLIQQHNKSLCKVQTKLENGEELSMLSNLVSLQVLDLSFCTRVTDLSLSVAVKFRELKVLSLNNLTKLTDKSLYEIAMSNPSLEELHVKSCIGLTDMSISHLLKQCPRLTILDVAQCDSLTSECLEDIVKFGKRLKHLDISFCGGLNYDDHCHWLNTQRPELKIAFRPYIF